MSSAIHECYKIRLLDNIVTFMDDRAMPVSLKMPCIFKPTGTA